MGGKIYEIREGFNKGRNSPYDIIASIKGKELMFLKSYRFSFYYKPCFSISAGKNRFCNKDRGIVVMNFYSVKTIQ